MLAMSATAIIHMISDRSTPNTMPRNTIAASVMTSANHGFDNRLVFLGVTLMNTG